MLSHIGGARSGVPPPYFDFRSGRGRGLKKVTSTKKKATKKETKKDGLYYQITESPIAKEFYDIITSDEVVTFSKDFLKVLISMWLYKTVYDATAPSRPVVETQTEPPRRGIVVEGHRDDDFGVAPIDVEDIIRSSGADISNLSESEQVILNDFIATTPSGERSCLSCFGLGLMDDISQKFKISPETKKLGKEAFKALLLAGLAGAVGAYSVSSAENDRNLNYDVERTDPTYIPPKKASYDIEGRTKNWTSEVKNKNMMNDILDEFSDISGDVSDIGHFSGTYGLGLKKTKEGTKPIGKIEIPDVLKNPKIASINNRIEDAIKYIYNKSPSKEVIMLFISVVFALGTALIFANSQTLTDSALDNIMNFTKIFEDCINGRVSLNSIQEYISHYTNYRGGKLIASHSGRGGKGVKPLSKKPKSSPKRTQSADIPESFYQKRIKPITKHVYDIITSDETITVAKTLAQLAFLTLIMYGIKELGTASLHSIQNTIPTPRRTLTELGEEEIARPTYYEGVTGRNRGVVTEYNKSNYPRHWPTNVGMDSDFHPDADNLERYTKANRILADTKSKSIYESKLKMKELISTLQQELTHDELMYQRVARQAMDAVDSGEMDINTAQTIIRDVMPKNPIHIKNIFLKHEILRDPERGSDFYKTFSEYLPTNKEILAYKSAQDATGRVTLNGLGLKEDVAKLSKTTLAKLKKIAKKIYDKIRSEEGQDAVKGLTVATILTGLAALMHSRMRTHPRQLSPEELKEQYMESIGESVLF
jgi:hypothetical protein